MATIRTYLEFLLPFGSRPDVDGYDRCPPWPPDAFAIAAKLVEQSDCYAFARSATATDGAYIFSNARLDDLADAGEAWREGREVGPAEIAQQCWDAILAKADSDVIDCTAGTEAWRDAALQLLIIADEASKGIGFPDPTGAKNKVRGTYFEEYFLDLRVEDGRRMLPYLPHSLCAMVPADRVCVQPKTNTPQSGCNLRSLTHNLALLPSRGVVNTRWRLPGKGNLDRRADIQGPMNLLLVPYPYDLRGRNFYMAGEPRLGPDKGARPHGFFSLDMKWLGAHRRDAGAFAKALRLLTETAREEVGDVHAVILPEAALSPEFAKAAADCLSEVDGLELFITGILGRWVDGSSANWAETFRLLAPKHYFRSAQKKHHRWRLERSQIQRYSLGHSLDPDAYWWEAINIAERECNFDLIRWGTCLTVLICEDLARSDPVLPAIQAVGPNLVIALLMDGAQLKHRWPARHAMVLADDPGSSVLTLTCLGMVKRSTELGRPESREIGLWKEPNGDIVELRLPHGALGLILTLAPSQTTQVTLHQRSDEGHAVVLRLAGVTGVYAELEKACSWIGRA